MSRKSVLRNALIRHASDMPGLAFAYDGDLSFVSANLAHDPIPSLIGRLLQTRLRREYSRFLRDLRAIPPGHPITCPFGLEFSFLPLDDLFGLSSGIMIYHSIGTSTSSSIQNMYATALCSRRERKVLKRICMEIEPWRNARIADVDKVFSILRSAIENELDAYREDAFTNALSSYKDFVSSFSHEALSPIQQIRTSLEFALTDADLKPSTRTRVEGDLQALDSLRISLEGMRLLFKDQEKPLANRFREVDLREIASRCCDMYRSQFAAKNIEIRLEPLIHKWTVRVIPEYVEVMVRNLVSNAAKYSFDATGRDTAGNFIIRYDDKSGEMRFINFGVPIPSVEIDKIFEFGYRAETSHDRGRAGKGVGLYLVAHIARLHDAECEAHSRIQNPGYENLYARNEFVVRFRKLKGGLH